VIATRPAHTSELLPAERQFLETLRTLGFGRVEHLQVRDGEIVLDPRPTIVRELKLGAPQWTPVEPKEAEYELKREAAEFFEFVRSVECGQIRALEVRRGLPSLMHTLAADPRGGERRA
jgi:hypothetical protein